MSEHGGGRPATRLLVNLLERGELTARRAAVIIGVYTLGITVLGGAIARLLDPSDFNSFGNAIWWALQTVTSVGYGDIVPRDTIGRIVGGLLMLSGIAFLAVVTASVTAALIETVRVKTGHRGSGLTSEAAKEISARLDSIEARFEKLEAALRIDRN